MLIAASIVGLTYILVSVQRLPGIRIDRPSGALVGAGLMVLSGVLTLEQALAGIDLHILAFLLGMLVIVDYLRIAGFFEWAAKKLIGHGHTPTRLLWLTVLGSGFFSALFVNDTVCLLFTPVVLLVTARFGIRPLPYLIAVATASNVGSAATLIGNPQNMVIGVASGIPFLEYTARVFPVVAIGLVANVFVVKHAFAKDFTMQFVAVEIGAEKPLRMGLIVRTLVVLACVITGFAYGWPYALVAMTGATALILGGGEEPQRVLAKVDWALLLFFAGLFVVMAGVEESGLVTHLISTVEPWLSGGIGGQLGGLLGITAVLSNLVSNVPAVLLLRPMIEAHGNLADWWVMLALSATFAGNLTLLGSVANLIVAGIARSAGHPIGFVDFLRVGVPLTLITLATAWLWLVF
jgi:Na+/H+ antiporter NhaD/arsenite permease-like protein